MKDKNQIFSIQLKGALDGNSSLELFAYIQSQVDLGFTKFLFQMNGVEYITSHGIALLLKIQAFCKEKGNIAFVFLGFNQEAQSVLSLLGLWNKLPIAIDAKEAEQYLDLWTVSVAKEPEEKGKKLQFYFSGMAKDKPSELPVSRLQPLSPSKIGSELEEKIKSIKQELKETLSLELDKKIQEIKPSSRLLHPNLPKPEPANESLPQRLKPKSLETPEKFEKIFPCEACGTTLRATRVGRHQCPLCKSEMFIGQNGVLRYLEKLSS